MRRAGGVLEAGSGGRSSMLRLLQLVLAPIVWALHFGIVYGGHTLICALGEWMDSGSPHAAARWLVALTTLAALAAIAGLAASSARRRHSVAWAAATGPQRFEIGVTVLLAALSAIAIIWAGVTAALLPACRAA